MNTCRVACILVLAALAGCSSEVEPTQLRVAAAADLRFALEALTREWGSGPAGLAITYGSSGNLYAQIVQGAPFDVFLSADASYSERLRDARIGSEVFAYARGRLAVWVPAKSALAAEQDGVAAIARSGPGRVAIANPEHAPYGRAAMEVLGRTGLEADVRHRLVFGDNVGQAFEFVRSGNASVGIIALSLVLGPHASGGRYWTVNADLHEPLRQAGVIVLRSQYPRQAAEFRDFLMSGRGQAVLADYGFERP